MSELALGGSGKRSTLSKWLRRVALLPSKDEVGTVKCGSVYKIMARSGKALAFISLVANFVVIILLFDADIECIKKADGSLDEDNCLDSWIYGVDYIPVNSTARGPTSHTNARVSLLLLVATVMGYLRLIYEKYIIHYLSAILGYLPWLKISYLEKAAAKANDANRDTLFPLLTMIVILALTVTSTLLMSQARFGTPYRNAEGMDMLLAMSVLCVWPTFRYTVRWLTSSGSGYDSIVAKAEFGSRLEKFPMMGSLGKNSTGTC